MSHTTEERKELFTQGEWKAMSVNNSDYFDIDSEFGRITSVLIRDETKEEGEAKANALLIAASPDLYYALKNLHEGREKGGISVMDWEILFDMAKLALDKAIGK
jgi:hypothetical protein